MNDYKEKINCYPYEGGISISYISEGTRDRIISLAQEARINAEIQRDNMQPPAENSNLSSKLGKLVNA